MANSGGTTRRRFLKSGALALAGLGFASRAHSAPQLKLKKPIKIGCQTILSGPLGGYGEYMRKGALLAMEEINGQGGIGGSPIEVNFRDEELKVDVGVKNARYFVDDWGADFLIGIDSSAVALAVGEIMPTLNRVLIVTHGATEKFNEDLVFKKHIKQCFRISVPVYQDGIASAMVAKDLPVKRWATISPDYEYGHTSWKMFRATLKKLKRQHDVPVLFVVPDGKWGRRVTHVATRGGFAAYPSLDALLQAHEQEQVARLTQQLMRGQEHGYRTSPSPYPAHASRSQGSP